MDNETLNNRVEFEGGLDRLLTEKMILSQFVPIARSTWWKGVREGKFPKPVKVAGRSMWRESDLQKFLENLH